MSATHDEQVFTNTGISNRKLAFWFFIASETMFFGALLVTYTMYAYRAPTGPTPQELFNIPLTTISTFNLLMSSLAMVLAVHALERGQIQKMRLWLCVTIVLGLGFLGFQVYEFSHFYHQGLTLSGSLFGTSFYVLTGFHGTHVAVGVLWLVSLLIFSLRGGLNEKRSLDLEIAGLFWHFVDIVWIVLFTVVYLVEGVRAL